MFPSEQSISLTQHLGECQSACVAVGCMCEFAAPLGVPGCICVGLYFLGVSVLCLCMPVLVCASVCLLCVGVWPVLTGWPRVFVSVCVCVSVCSPQGVAHVYNVGL